jgi:hypothetical protein
LKLALNSHNCYSCLQARGCFTHNPLFGIILTRIPKENHWLSTTNCQTESHTVIKSSTSHHWQELTVWDIQFYSCPYVHRSVCPSRNWFPPNNYFSSYTDHLKFIHKVRNHKGKAHFDFWLYCFFSILELSTFFQVTQRVAGSIASSSRTAIFPMIDEFMFK